MRKKILTIYSLLLIIAIGFTATHFTHAQLIDHVTNSVFSSFTAWIGNIIMSILGKVLWLAGILLNSSIFWTLNISLLVQKVGAITIVWKTIRDFSNMVIIFLLLYEAFIMILGKTNIGAKQLLVNIVLVGILINFSLFFTNLVIDASNVVAFQFYKSIAPNPGAYDNGISNAFMQALKLQTSYDPSALGASPAPGATSGNLNEITVIFATVLGSIVELIAAFLFFAAAIMFIIRIGILIILMAFSPLAFVSWIIPKTQSFAKRWQDELISQAFFPAAYLAMIYMGMKILTYTSPGNGSGTSDFNQIINGSGSFNSAFSGASPQSAGIILNYSLVIIFLTSALVVAKQFGGAAATYGLEYANTAKKWLTNKTQAGAQAGGKWAWNNVGGRAANALANNERMKDWASKSTVFGTLALKGVKAVGSGYAAGIEKAANEKTKYAESLGYDRKAAIPMEQKIRDLSTTLNDLNQRVRLAKKTGIKNAIDDAVDKQKKGEDALKTAKGDLEKFKNSRKVNYGEALENTLWFKVAKNRQKAAAKIRIDLLNKEIEDTKKKIDDSNGELNKLEGKERAWDGGRGGGPALSVAEEDRLKELRDGKAKKEEEIRDKKLKISQLELIK